jgi:Zn-dependent protease
VHEAPDARYLPEDLRGYDPLHPQGMDVRSILRKIWGGIVAVAVLLFKFGFLAIKDAPNDPWRNALISIAGPFLGGIGAAVCWGIGAAIDSRLMYALAYSGFLLNLFNLIPFLPLDGGFIVGAARALRRPIPAMQGDTLVYEPPRNAGRGMLVWAMYLGLAALLVLGMVYAHVPQNRL